MSPLPCKLKSLGDFYHNNDTICVVLMIIMLDYKDADNDDIEVFDEYDDDTNDDNIYDTDYNGDIDHDTDY